MKNLLLFSILAALILMILACPKINNKSSSAFNCGCAKQDSSGCKTFPLGHNGFCASDTCGPNLCSFLPRDVDVVTPNGYNAFIPVCQTPFDWFSWQTFIALNWPADAHGMPIGTNINNNPDALRVWETYMEAGEIFGTQTSAKSGGLKVLSSIAKGGFDHFNGANSDQEAFTGSPLIDRNLNFALYEIRVNPVEASYIISNNLNTYNGQKSFGTVNFPSGFYPDSVGSMEIKVSWRILVPGIDNFGRYYHRQAIVSLGKADVVGGQTIDDTVTIGLIGMHIIRKVKNNGSFWIWSSFEQIDNAPDSLSLGKQGYSFYNPACTTCTLNQAPSLLPGDTAFLWSPASGKNPQYARRYAPNGYGTQVYRVYPVDVSASAVTQQWQAKLKAENSVWQYYQLIGSQWGAQQDFFGGKLVGIPLAEANTVAETYLQPYSPPFSGSCLNCHAVAKTSVGKDANFSFLLGGLTPPKRGGK
ncbi:MAG: hypothetical protein ACKVUS_00280 [Saprospiraceae bacterium]